MPSDRLARASSPYLKMHAADPVDWWPWGEEAFALARSTERPIFLSSGYAACHWCHVMQRESFRDTGTAAFLNERFVPVKLDRELRPDVDSVYMDYLIATTGRGGWPMSVFLTPGLAPILAGSYFPKEAPHGTATFMDVLRAVDALWRGDRQRALADGEAALRFLREETSVPAAVPFGREVLDDAAAALVARADRTHGGFDGAPKFPLTPVVSFLARYAQETGDAEAAAVVDATLRGVLRGGIYDQAGGGMARYATDEAWLVPHFEKMLYDNALLLSMLAAAARLALSDEYVHAARRTAAFLQRDLGAPGGGFFSALSADTEGVEGGTYTWSYEELAEELSADELALAERELGVTRDGNWEGATILTRPHGRDASAEAVDALLDRLLAARSRRAQPDVDTKVLMSWNALAARGLVEAGAAFDDRAMTGLGLATLERLDDAVSGDEVPHDVEDAGSARLLEDYADLAAAAVAAYEAVGDDRWLERARTLQHAAVSRFGDGELFMTPRDVDLPVRPRERGDSPTPSGASTLAHVGVRLYAVTGEERFLTSARARLEQTLGLAEAAPEHAGAALEAMLAYFAEATARVPST